MNIIYVSISTMYPVIRVFKRGNGCVLLTGSDLEPSHIYTCKAQNQETSLGLKRRTQGKQ